MVFTWKGNWSLKMKAMSKKAEKYSSPLIKELMAERDPVQTAKTRNRMILAAKIEDAYKAKGWNKKEFAEEMGKEPSVITKWLSGTHNFTADTLTEIGLKLGIKLLNTSFEEVTVSEINASVKQEAENMNPEQYTLLPGFLSASYKIGTKALAS